MEGEGFKVKGERIESYEDLEVYQRLCQLHLEINEETLRDWFYYDGRGAMNDEQKQRNSKPKKSRNFSLVDDYGCGSSMIDSSSMIQQN